MKYLKLVLIGLIPLFIVIMAMSLLIPSDVHISRAINSHLPAEALLRQVRDLGQWKNWYPGFDSLSLEPLQQDDSRIVAAQVPGAVITITEDTANRVSAVFAGAGNRKSVYSRWQVISYEHTDSVTLQWYMDFHLRWYPWEKLSSLLFEKKYGVQMEAGLARLKAVAPSGPESAE